MERAFIDLCVSYHGQRRKGNIKPVLRHRLTPDIQHNPFPLVFPDAPPLKLKRYHGRHFSFDISENFAA
jgi:hypothetical protein